MKKHPKLGKILSYTWRLAALAAIFIGGYLGLAYCALILHSRGVIDLGALFVKGRDEDWVFTLVFIIPIVAVIIISWIFQNRNIKRTLIFWGITAIVGAVISVPFVIDAYFGHDIKVYFERRNAQQSDYIFKYPAGTEDRIGIENATRYVNLKEMKVYWETPTSFGYSDLLPARADTPEGYFAEMTDVWYVSYTWDGNDKITRVYAISHINTPYELDDILIETADGRLFYAGYYGHYL